MLAAIKESFRKKPYTTSQAKAANHRAPSIAERLPWRDYDSADKVFLLQDGKTVAALFELKDVASEARSPEFLEQMRSNFQGIFQDVFPTYFDNESPWVVQFFVQDELSLDEYASDYEHYIRPGVSHFEFTKTYLAIVKNHLSFMTRPEGLFTDDAVSGNVFRGKYRKIRAVIYRKLSGKAKSKKGRTGIEDLNIVANSFRAKLEGTGVEVRRLEAQDFYYWMTNWFNPSKNVPAYPGDDNLPYGYDFSEKFFFTTPESDDSKGVWFFNKKPHKYLPIVGLSALPKTGQLTAEREFGSHFYGLFDRFPEGSVFQMTVVIQSQEEVNNHIDHIERTAKKASHMQATMAREDSNKMRRAIEERNFAFPTTMGVYIKGEGVQELYRNETDVETLLSTNGYIHVNGDTELLHIDNYLRFLPMCYDYQFDKRFLSKSRYQTGIQLSQILPLYGRERGTGHPGLPFYNRGGEPLTIDPLNPSDKDNNSHLLLLGTTGSGKSAASAYLMMNLMALYRPRLMIVDAGNSFGLLSDYFSEQGLSVNRVEISLNTSTSLNPFAESAKLLIQVDRMNQLELLESVSQQEADLAEAAEEATASEKLEELENRDYMGEMSLAAQLLITGGEAKEEDKITRQDRMLILDGLVRAARKANDDGFDQMIPEDLAGTFLKMSKALRASEPDKAKRLIEMADGIKIFTKDALSAQFFNRRGQPWPDADVTILEMGMFKEDGYEAQRALAFMGAMNKTMSMAESNQADSRFTVFFADECHIVTSNPLTAVAVTKYSKMSRKIGLWLWLATQNVRDFPNEARKLLSMIEFWICLGMSSAELEEVERFRTFTDEERTLFRSVRKAAGKYTEGILLCNRFKGLFRNIPPRLSLALAMTEKHEKFERKALMKKHKITELEAARLKAQMLMGFDEKEAVSKVKEHQDV